jgi:hypothetical protein
MDICVSEARQFGNRRILSEHRLAVRAADDAQPRKAAPEDAPLTQESPADQAAPPVEKGPISMRTVWIYLGVVAAIAAFALVRAIGRRARGNCSPVG